MEPSSQPGQRIGARFRRIIAVALLALVLALPAVRAEAEPSKDHPTWSQSTPLPFAMQEVSSTISGDHLYVAGGLGIPGQAELFSKKHFRMNLKTRSWEALADLPVASHHLQAFAVGDKIIYLGGEEGAALVANGRTWEYDPARNTFRELARMPADRVRGATAAALHDGKIYVAGGAKLLNFGERQFDVFDPQANTWTALPDAPHVREHAGAAVVDGRLHVVGGRNLLPVGYVHQTDVYDFEAGRWTSGSPIPHGRGGLGVIAVDGLIYTFGGEGPGVSFDDVEVLDPATGKWRAVERMPLARHGIQAAVHDGVVYLAGGAALGLYGPAADVQVFRP